MSFVRIKDIRGDNHHVNTSNIKEILTYDTDQYGPYYVVMLLDGTVINTNHRYVMEAVKILNIFR